MYRKLLISFIFLIYLEASGNDSLSYHLVYFKDKPETIFNLSKPNFFLSNASIKRRQKWGIALTKKDLPVHSNYLQSLGKVEGVKIINASKWLNAAEISSTGDTHLIRQIRALDCVSKIELIGRLRVRSKANIEEIDDIYHQKAKELKQLKQTGDLPAFSKSDYNKSFQQNQMIGVPLLHQQVGRMQNFHIAVFDAGFYKAYRIHGMEDLLDSTMVIRDFVDYDNSVWEDDQHGCNVLGFMKTYNPGEYIGSAPFAKYTLIRTENTASESLLEEVNWLLAAEFADSLGVDMIAASVGYHSFDDPAFSHTHSQLDGKTSIIARAATEAYNRGIMVICSAGNEGSNKWRKIGTPGDADATITIGACDEKGFHVRFSSYGPTADGRVKPDFLVPGYKVTVASAFGFYAGNGTSYSTPIFAGAMANLMYLFPTTPLNDLKKAALFSASQRALPDSAYGYGIPDLALAACKLGKCSYNTDSADIFWIKEEAVLFQDLNIYFRSSIQQSVKIWVKTNYEGKTKTLHKTSEKMSAGEWFESDILLRIAGGKQKKRKRKYPIKTLILIFETENGSFQRTFQLG